MTTHGAIQHGWMERSVADLGALAPGAHLCSLYRDIAELELVAATFVGSGLAMGDRVLYVADDRQPSEVQRALEANGVLVTGPVASGQLIVRSFTEIYGPSGNLDLISIADSLRTAADRSHAEGFPGLRVAAEMGDFRQRFGSMEQLLRWERLSSRMQQESGISSVCHYDQRHLSDSDAALIAVEHSGFAPGRALASLASFLATKTPWGLRVVGEVDRSNNATFVRTLRARLSVCSQLCLNVGELSFVDAGALNSLYQTAAGLPEDGGIHLVDPSVYLRQIIELIGLHHPRVVIDS